MICKECENQVSEIKEFRTSELYTLTQICPKCGVIAQTSNVIILNPCPLSITSVVQYR